MTIEKMKEKLKAMLTAERYEHSLGVAGSAKQLAERYGENEAEAVVAGLLHDCAKDIDSREILSQCRKFGIEADEISLTTPRLLHGLLGSEYARNIYGIDNERILNAIRTHTTGSENMDLLQKIIFIADFIEPGRKFGNVGDLRRLAFENLDKAVLMGLDLTIESVIRKGRLLHFDTVKARNYILAAQMSGKHI